MYDGRVLVVRFRSSSSSDVFLPPTTKDIQFSMPTTCNCSVVGIFCLDRDVLCESIVGQDNIYAVLRGVEGCSQRRCGPVLHLDVLRRGLDPVYFHSQFLPPGRIAALARADASPLTDSLKSCCVVADLLRKLVAAAFQGQSG